MKKPSKNGHRPSVEYTSLAQLTSDPKNARRHTPRNVGTIVDALHEVGAARSIVIDENGVVLAGNATMDAAIEAGLSKVQVVDGDGETVIAVRRTGLTAEQKTRLALYDNRAAELAEWNPEILADLAPEEIKGMFSDKELAEILSQTGVEPKDAQPQIDKAEELRQKWGTESGQLWEIGNHWLLVGDATNKADVERLCGSNRPSLMVTDPPYGVDYDGGEINQRKRAKLEGDQSSDLYEPAFALSPSNVAYAWFADTEALSVYGAAVRNGFEPRALIIWNKLKAHYGAPSAHYKQRSEPCLYAVRKGNSAKWIGDMTEPTVWDIEQPHVNQFHSTQKPLECMARPIRNHSGDVYDPFVGSGTTIVAAENLTRKCYAMEISPAYVAVCLERMATAFPHLKIERHQSAVAA